MASLVLVSLSGAVGACTFGEGHQEFEFTLGEQEFVAREGEMKSGDQVAFLSYGGMMDVFIFNEEQYFSYLNAGKERAGWRGAALFKDLGVVSSQTVFTAPMDGVYFYVIDNTMAGLDSGEEVKVVQHDSTFPFAGEPAPAFPFYFPLFITGIVVFALAVLAFFSYDGRR